MRLLPGELRRVSLLLLTLALFLGVPAASASADSAGTTDSAVPSAASPRPTDPIAHDPTLAKQGAYYYVVITGDARKANTYLPMMRSKDLVHWQQLGPVFNALPSWVTQQLGTTPADAWGADLQWSHGQWRLYYAASVFGTQNSVIGLATSPTLDPDNPDYKWTDQGMVLRSSTGADDFNAIDPDYVDDGHGGAWLAFGSFWGGIKMFRLDPATGKLSTTDTTEHSLAARVAPDAEEGRERRHGLTAHSGSKRLPSGGRLDLGAGQRWHLAPVSRGRGHHRKSQTPDSLTASNGRRCCVP